MKLMILIAVSILIIIIVIQIYLVMSTIKTTSVDFQAKEVV